MTYYADLLPRDKHDFTSVHQIKKLERHEQLPLLPELLVWIQDMNWPIAEEVAELLLLFPDELVPLIKDVLNTDDQIWKYWCLIILVKRLPKDVRTQFSSELTRLIDSPSPDEKLEELDEIAQEIVQLVD